MTIICWDGKTLASDSQGTQANGMVSIEPVTKLTKCEPGEKWTIYNLRIVAFALTGTSTMMEPVRSMLRKGMWFDEEENSVNRSNSDSSSILAITEEGECIFVDIYTDGKLYTIIDGRTKEAIGMGCNYARVLLGDGKDSVEAVQKVCERYDGCGGPVQSVEIKKWVKQLKKEEEKLPEDFVYIPKIIPFKSEKEELEKPKEEEVKPVEGKTPDNVVPLNPPKEETKNKEKAQ